MLFVPPALTSGLRRLVAPTAALAPVSELDVFSPWPGALGTVLHSMDPTTVVCSGFHGWLTGRRPVIFQAERKKLLGTVLLSPLNPRVRVVFHGWLTARFAGHFPSDSKRLLGTAAASNHHRTVVRSGFHGWFAGRRPVIFQPERKKLLGTVLLSPLNPRVRAVFHGWLTARLAGHFPSDSKQLLGTAAASNHHRTVVRSGFHGWLTGRRPMTFMSEASEQGTAGGSGYHVSVLPKETEKWMKAGTGKFIIDGTLGGGGHSELFLESGACVLGVDRDPEALAYASRRLERFGARFSTWQGNFADLRDNPEVRGEKQADGLLLDLGVSSRQLDTLERGFSFRGSGPLDMRMGPATPLTAASVVNEWAEDEIVSILREFGEEPRARRIAAAIVRQRQISPFQTTSELAECIEKEVGRYGRTHPATRSFQAIRIAVNDELGSLKRALEASVHLLKPGGRLLVITFHSLEDRMVKRFMQQRAKPFIDQPNWPAPRPNPDLAFCLPQRKAIAPSREEIRINPRARSAKLRVAELLDPSPSLS